MHAVSLRIRESFWFLPALFGIGAIVLAALLVALDRTLVERGATEIWFLDALSASGGRSILTTVGTSMLTVAGTSFSITISVLATTSSTYGPRLVRNFMADRANQFVLAAFTSTFLYAIVVLRSVHTAVDDGDAFVPVIAIHVAVLIGVFDVAVLVFFIHHIASSTQINALQEQVQADLESALDHAYRSSGSEGEHSPRTSVGTPDLPQGPWMVVTAPEDGYLQSLGWRRLVEWARDHDAVVEMLAMPGDHLLTGTPVFRVAVAGTDAPAGLDEQGGRLARAAVAIGPARTPAQDVGFALQQLVEIAVRGLASGTNDPYTAVSALDLSAAPLVALWRGKLPVTAYRDADGVDRVLTHWPAPDRLVDSVFAGILTYGTEHPIVVEAGLRLAHRLEQAAPAERRGHLAHTIECLEVARR